MQEQEQEQSDEALRSLDDVILARGKEIADALNDKFRADDPITLSALVTLTVMACQAAGAKKASFFSLVRDTWRRGKIEEQQRQVREKAEKEP